MITRRTLLKALAAGVVAGARIARAQQAEGTYRLGWLNAADKFGPAPYHLALVERLRQLGFVQGRNFAIEFRTAEGHRDRLPALAAELASRNCDVLFAPGPAAVLLALRQASRDTPIVVAAVDYDLEASGYVDSLAHPGGRITGVSALQSVLPAKRLELLKELRPRIRRVAVFSDSASAGQLAVAQDAAKRLGIKLDVIRFTRAPYDYESAFARADRARAQALLALGSANFVPGRPLIGRLALGHRLPSIFHHSVWAEAGGLMSYGANFSDIFRLVANQISRILKGERPADIPVEQPTHFELVINLKTARALRLTIPQTLMARADRFVE